MAPLLAATVFAFLTPGPTQVIILGVVVLLLFGNRIPSVMRSLGEGITEFKKGIKSGDSDEKQNLEDKRDEDKRDDDDQFSS